MIAQYLLRFDDLCPTMDKQRWDRFAHLMQRFSLRPILAVVPDNLDPELVVAPPNPGFWEEMRQWQQAGAAIGLHGYQHLCRANGGGLVPLHRQTEFAGARPGDQRTWIATGMATLRSHGLEPSIWVAPRHGFDASTLAALRQAGVQTISDGLAIQPFQSRGFLWIPQQLWEPQQRDRGLWTICLHANSASDATYAALERFLTLHAHQFTSIDRVLAEWPIRERSWQDRVTHMAMLARRRFRQWKRKRAAIHGMVQ